ncbi:Transcription elongation factor A protein-like 8 [Saguinus oedipus]|uniref:Transcription elongation factor A protein-like 8 n=1 Tax=Saguinus oedipus TaxID=9490 RepID=A0ABQ9V9G8_SAGOE|nr:Transcription elongation factor A protein-like 8 [Saguinus oedipus]
MQKSFEENDMPKAEEDRSLEDVPQEAEGNPQPSEEGVSQEAEGNPRGGPTQPGQEFTEDTPVRHLDPEEIIRGVDELERLREEIRRVLQDLKTTASKDEETELINIVMEFLHKQGANIAFLEPQQKLFEEFLQQTGPSEKTSGEET